MRLGNAQKKSPALDLPKAYLESSWDWSESIAETYDYADFMKIDMDPVIKMVVLKSIIILHDCIWNINGSLLLTVTVRYQVLSSVQGFQKVQLPKPYLPWNQYRLCQKRN